MFVSFKTVVIARLTHISLFVIYMPQQFVWPKFRLGSILQPICWNLIEPNASIGGGSMHIDILQKPLCFLEVQSNQIYIKSFLETDNLLDIILRSI